MDSAPPNPSIITKDLKKKEKTRQITIELCTFLNVERWDPLIRNLTLSRDIAYIKVFVCYFKMFKVNIFLWNHSVEGLAPRLNKSDCLRAGLEAPVCGCHRIRDRMCWQASPPLDLAMASTLAQSYADLKHKWHAAIRAQMDRNLSSPLK